MLNIAICDDNKEDRKIIFEKLELYLVKNNIEAKITEFQDGEDLVECINIRKRLFDIVLLDIFMEFLDGIETASKIRDMDPNCKIIFLTASSFHAIQSYEVKATYYLLKPVEDEKLFKALKIAIESIENTYSKYVVLKSNNEITKLFFDNILFIESKARVLLVYTKQNNIVTLYKKLNDFEIELSDKRFLRSHKSFLVNLDFVKEIKDPFFILETNHSIPISGSFKNKKKVYMEYLVSKL